MNMDVAGPMEYLGFTVAEDGNCITATSSLVLNQAIVTVVHEIPNPPRKATQSPLHRVMSTGF